MRTVHRMNDDQISENDEAVETEPARRSWWSRCIGAFGAHPAVSALVVLVVFAGGFVGVAQVRKLIDPPFQQTSFRVPSAPKLVPAVGETVYRIDPTRSEARYDIDEKLFGATASTATARTNGIAGDFAVNRANPAASRAGTIVINVEQFTSDSTLRDARIRSDFLESHAHPLAKFVPSGITGLPASIEPGRRYNVELAGDLTIKSTTHPVTWNARVALVGEQLEATATTTVNLSTFGVGPISIAGLVSTSNEAKLTLKLVAVDPTKQDVPTDIANLQQVATSTAGPSFSKAVRPILEKNCVACHSNDAIGSEIWKLESAADASADAVGIALVTANRYMPPWPPSHAGVPMQHDRSLSAHDLEVLGRWAKAGGQLDVDGATELKARPTTEPAPPRRDLVLKMPKAYAGDGTKTNDYRCIILDPRFTSPTYVTGTEFTPGTRQVVHHALIYRIPAADADATRQLDGKDGRPGWGCDAGGAMSATDSLTQTRPGSGTPRGSSRALFAGWVPGQRPHSVGKNTGFFFQPRDLIVVQIHYHYSDAVLPDRSTLSLQTQAPTPEMRELKTTSPIAPVELPCPQGATGALCDRAALVQSQAVQYGPAAALIPTFILAKCGADSVTSDPVTGNGASRCDWRVRTTGHIVDVLGHMHNLGKTFRMTLNPGTDRETVLLDIGSWSFDWQLNYQPVTPVPVQSGDTIRIECAWDRSQRYDPDPRYIVFAEGTEDEMCFSTYTIDPDRPRGNG